MNIPQERNSYNSKMYFILTYTIYTHENRS